MTPEIQSPWPDQLDCAITLCDNEGIVIYQNQQSQAVNGSIVGQSLIPCHSERSREIIAKLLKEGSSNTYTIEKRGIRKLIHQSAWRVDGNVGGLVEFSIILPDEMPHYKR